MVHVHSHYPGEVMMAMHLAREYRFIDRMALSHVQDVYPIADILAKTKIISVVGPKFIVRFYGDRVSHNVVKELMEAGAAASIQTDESAEQAKCFREYGSFHIRHGLSEEHALEALTINGAKAMMLDERIGSIEVGKDADLVLMNGPAFDVHAERIEKVFVDGVLEYERKETRQTALPTPVGPFRPIRGGFKAGDRTFALTNAHIFTVSGGHIRSGTIAVENGKITEVRAGGETPRDVPVLDIGGRVVLPGWVSARAFPNDYMGDLKWQVQNNENIEPILPEMDARFAFDPWFPSFEVIRRIGITAQNITLNAAWAFRNGTPELEALKMFTLNAAEMIDMGDRIGSIDVGKDADFMVLEGHPFDYRVLPQVVFIDGELVFSSRPGDRGLERTTSGGPEL